MIQSGLMQTTGNISFPVQVYLHPNGYEEDSVGYFVSNVDAIPLRLINEMNHSSPEGGGVGVFDYDPEDQFARYIPDDKLQEKE